MPNRLRPFIIAIAASLMVTGCAHNAAEKISGYKRPYDFTSPDVRSHNYRSNIFRAKYDALLKDSGAATNRSNLEAARLERNQILTELVGIIEAEHGEYERGMMFKKATMEIVFDFAELGLSGAGTVIGGASTKAVLAAIATGTKGADIALNKRVFHDQAVEALQAQMRAAQKSRKAQIIQSMTNDVLAYPLELGLADVVEYYYDGTLTRAFQALVQDAKKNEEDAQWDVDNALKREHPTTSKRKERPVEKPVDKNK